VHVFINYISFTFGGRAVGWNITWYVLESVPSDTALSVICRCYDNGTEKYLQFLRFLGTAFFQRYLTNVENSNLSLKLCCATKLNEILLIITIRWPCLEIFCLWMKWHS